MKITNIDSHYNILIVFTDMYKYVGCKYVYCI